MLFIGYICITNHAYVSLGSKGLYLVDSVCDRSNVEYYRYFIKKSFNIYVNKRKHMTLSGSKYGLFSCLCLLLFIDANLCQFLCLILLLLGIDVEVHPGPGLQELCRACKNSCEEKNCFSDKFFLENYKLKLQDLFLHGKNLVNDNQLNPKFFCSSCARKIWEHVSNLYDKNNSCGKKQQAGVRSLYHT